MDNASQHRSRQGLLYGLGAYTLWGLIPLYFKAIASVPPIELVAHRVGWSFLFLGLIMTVGRRLGALLTALRSPGVMLRLGLSTLLLAVNWFTFIYAVATSQVLQSSLGYFTTPLMNVVLGVVFLKERLRLPQLLGVLLAACGMVNLALTMHQPPWVALSLAVSFGIYGLLRKTVAADGLLGLFIETLLLLPAAMAYIVWLRFSGSATVGLLVSRIDVLLVFSGLVTSIPLLLFAAAARRLTLSSLAFMQYLAPTLQFLLAVLVFREPFSTPQLVSFACIWGAVAIYSGDSLLLYRRGRTRMPQVPRIEDEVAADL